jgi:hypothetical protein
MLQYPSRYSTVQHLAQFLLLCTACCCYYTLQHSGYITAANTVLLLNPAAVTEICYIAAAITVQYSGYSTAYTASCTAASTVELLQHTYYSTALSAQLLLRYSCSYSRTFTAHLLQHSSFCTAATIVQLLLQ